MAIAGARDYKELVDHLHLEQPVLVGRSMAGNKLLKYTEQFGTALCRGDGIGRRIHRRQAQLMAASAAMPADTAVVLIYNAIAVKHYSAAVAKLTRPVLFAYQPGSQQSAEVLKAKPGGRGSS